jgi:hypothetical protein
MACAIALVHRLLVTKTILLDNFGTSQRKTQAFALEGPSSKAAGSGALHHAAKLPHRTLLYFPRAAKRNGLSFLSHSHLSPQSSVLELFLKLFPCQFTLAVVKLPLFRA